MAEKQPIRRLKTFGENIVSLGKAAGVLSVALVGLNAIGFNTDLNILREDLSSLQELAIRGGAFSSGFAVGFVQNAVLVGATLGSLSGKTSAGGHDPYREENDGTQVYQLSCIDNRRTDTSGGAIAGSFGPIGAEFLGLLGALAAQRISPNTEVGDFATGYFLGSNIITTAYSHVALLKEVITLAAASSSRGNRVKIEMIDHWKGCGAEGFTNPLTYFLKFITHSEFLADISASPNELAGYIYVNGVLGPAVGLLTGGKVSLSAVERHSDIK